MRPHSKIDTFINCFFSKHPIYANILGKKQPALLSGIFVNFGCSAAIPTRKFKSKQ